MVISTESNLWFALPLLSYGSSPFGFLWGNAVVSTKAVIVIKVIFYVLVVVVDFSDDSVMIFNAVDVIDLVVYIAVVLFPFIKLWLFMSSCGQVQVLFSGSNLLIPRRSKTQFVYVA